MSTTTESDPAHATAPLQRDWHDEQTLFGDYSGAVVSIRALSDAVLRVRLAPDGQFAPRRSWTVVPPDETFPPVVPEFGAAAGQAEIGTALLIARLEPRAARVTISERSSGRVLLADDSSDLPRTGEPLRWVKCLPDARTCHFYGFGERTGLLDKRGRRFTCWNTDRYEDQSANTDELYLSVPFFLSLNERGESFGLFLNNTYRSAFDLSEIDEGRLAIEFDGGELDYYLIYGPDPVDVVTRFADLTGRMPMPPRWSLGYHQARWSYGSDDEVRGIAGELRSRQIPADAICVDIDSMDELRVFTWDPARFPDPAALANDLREQGIRLIKVVDVGVKYEDGEDYPVLQEGIDHGYFLRTGREPEDPPFLCYVWPGLCAFPDFARAEVREWWGEQYRVLIDDGISGVLNDMNEPAMHDKPYDDPESFRTDPPPTLPHGPAEEPATHAEIHNLYGFLQAKATRAGLLRIRPDERPFVISRAGFAGIQQYAATWTGDNWSTWDHLEMSLPQLLNMGLSGIPFAGADIGGFYGNCEPELFARWMQLGAFYPFARSNSAKGTARQEPWAFGCDVEAVARRALELRYRLLPYLYTVFEEATRTGLPLLRPLFLHYADDPATHRIHDQALAGRDLLIAPVVRPGKRTREVYFPRGTWFDRRTGDRLTGPAHALIPASLDIEIPLFGRGGSVIPSGPTLEWTDQHPLHELTLDIYPDEHGAASGVLYEDDGRSLAYEHADWRTTTFTFNANTGILRARANGEHASPVQSVVIRRHDIDREVRFAAPQRADEWEIEV